MKKVFSIALPLITAAFLLASCEKESAADQWPQMRMFYGESCVLQAVSLDSVTRFAVKVDGFTATYPESKGHYLYPKIQANIKAASLRITITINDSWNGETFINY